MKEAAWHSTVRCKAIDSNDNAYCHWLLRMKPIWQSLHLEKNYKQLKRSPKKKLSQALKNAYVHDCESISLQLEGNVYAYGHSLLYIHTLWGVVIPLMAQWRSGYVRDHCPARWGVCETQLTFLNANEHNCQHLSLRMIVLDAHVPLNPTEHNPTIVNRVNSLILVTL